MKLTKYLALGAAIVAPMLFSACDSDSSSSSTKIIIFPSDLQNGDVIILDGVSEWRFTSPTTFTWSGLDNTLGDYRRRETAGEVLLREAGVTLEGATPVFEERLNVLLGDFTSLVRTIPYERQLAGEELTLADLIAIADEINEEAAERGEIIVTVDLDRQRLLLVTSYDILLTPEVGSTPSESFNSGQYMGTYVGNVNGTIITFRAPTDEERDSFRLTSSHRVPRVTSSSRQIEEPFEGTFEWTLSAFAPDGEPAPDPTPDPTPDPDPDPAPPAP